MHRHLRSILLTLACIAIAVAGNMGVHHQRDLYDRYGDFDVHYFGAQVERNGSYTETERVRNLLISAKGHAQPEGVVGTPTLIALVYMPLSHLPLPDAERTWTALALLTTALALLYATSRRFWPYVPLAILAFPLALGIQVGNISVITLALIAIAFGATRRNHNKTAGIALGIAAAFKLFPLVLLFAFVQHRNCKAVMWTAGIFTALTLAAIGILGPHDFFDGMKRTVTFDAFDIRYQDNVSIPGVLQYETGKAVFAKTVVVMTFMAGLWAIWRRRFAQPELTFAATALVMLLGNSLSWNHYFSILIVGIIALLEQPLDRRVKAGILVISAAAMLPNGWSPSLTLATLAVLIVLLTQTADPLPGRRDETR